MAASSTIPSHATPTPKQLSSAITHLAWARNIRLGYADGLTPPTPLPVPHPSSSSTPTLPYTARGRSAALTALGCSTAVATALSASLGESTTDAETELDIVNALAHPDNTRLAGLSSHWDISPAAAYPLDLTDLPLVVRRATGPAGTAGPQQAPVELYVLGETGGTPLNEQPYVLVVPHATTVLQIARSPWRGLAEISRQLADHGIEFHVAKYRPASSPETPTTPSAAEHDTDVGAHIKKKAEDADWKLEYRRYELQRDDFLRGPRGKLATRMGGIVARLARDVVGPTSLPTSHTPSTSAHPIALDAHATLLADTLTPPEVDLILGAYLIYRPAKRDTYTGRWWPTPPVWRASPLCTGEWTPRDEEWFQERLGRIRVGGVVPGKMAQMRAALRVGGKVGVGRVWSGYEGVAGEFLRGVL